ncbi:NADPH-dependent FMN reductase [Streptodolium elevatio]|uniref:NAD(P)H-dependent oxidoreductase n=1 Tax=Streptodolium elevatio TaxID=3157996 RepID=A0ABV3DIY8_9ACTN
MGSSTMPETDHHHRVGVETFRLAVIIGGVREGRFGNVVADWFIRQVERRDELDIDVIDLAEVDLPFEVEGRAESEPHDPGHAVSSAFTVRRRLDAADAYVVVTPEYHDTTALRRLVDWHGRPWQAKPVGFVAYGGTTRGGYAVDQLRPLFADLHAVPVRGQVTLPYAWELFDEDASSRQAAATEEAAQAMLDQLAWWAVTLRRGRERHPYAA